MAAAFSGVPPFLEVSRDSVARKLWLLCLVRCLPLPRADRCHASARAPDQEFIGGASVDLLHVRVADVGRDELEPLGHQLGSEDGDTREVAARTAEAGDEAGLDRIPAGFEDDWDRRSGVFCRRCRRGAVTRRDHVDLVANEVGGQCG